MAQMNTLPTTVVNKPVQKKTIATRTTGTGIRPQAHNQTRAKPLITKPLPSSRQEESTNAPKRRCPTRTTTAAVKTRQQEGLAKTVKSVAQPSEQSSKVEGTGAARLWGASSQASSGVANRCHSKVVNRAAQVAELARKSKECSRAVNKKEGGSTEVQPVLSAGPSVPQKVPCSAKSCRQVLRPEDMKTPKVRRGVMPQTETKRPTAAQEERMRKLQEWREARGISYKRPPMPVKPQGRRTVALARPYWDYMEENDEANSLICAVDRSLADCVRMLEKGCPPEQGKEVLSRLPAVAKKFAKYWIFQARLMEKEGNYDILPVFQEAVRVASEPLDELRTVVFEILKKKDKEGQETPGQGDQRKETPGQGDQSPEGTDDLLVTPKPVRALIFGNKGDSSVIKYKITATPGGPQSQKREPVQVNGQEVRFFTPVRRSIRIERTSVRYPASLQDHDLCVASYDDMMAEEERGSEEKGGEASSSPTDTTMYVYRENEALKDQVHIQLVYSDD
ncbi:cytoskeleton-associated protein 2-like [Lampris incognitus]|uniref:cytoskeleton-associated protein 2-like n=1 Tax=Lampris incognitus TaxID=2546036 RepID=UPI0024B480A5|nr:cytoskeleton-associated protein 2-like [Lampris incognitus]